MLLLFQKGEKSDQCQTWIFNVDDAGVTRGI